MKKNELKLFYVIFIFEIIYFKFLIHLTHDLIWLDYLAHVSGIVGT